MIGAHQFGIEHGPGQQAVAGDEGLGFNDQKMNIDPFGQRMPEGIIIFEAPLQGPFYEMMVHQEELSPLAVGAPEATGQAVDGHHENGLMSLLEQFQESGGSGGDPAHFQSIGDHAMRLQEILPDLILIRLGAIGRGHSKCRFIIKFCPLQ